jgi:hypothetical protein
MNWVKCSAVNTYSGQISLGLGEVLSKEVLRKPQMQKYQKQVVTLEVRGGSLLQESSWADTTTCLIKAL